MSEAVCVFATGSRREEILARQAQQLGVDLDCAARRPRAAARRFARTPFRPRPRAPAHRAHLWGADRVGQPAKRGSTGGSSRPVPLSKHRRHLLDVERVALGCFLDARSRFGVERPFLAKLVEQRIGFCIGEWREHDPSCVRRGQPALAFLEHFGARQAKEQDRCIMRPAREVLDQVEQRRCRPVDVLDHDDKRPVARNLFEQTAHGPEQLTTDGRRAGRTDCAQDPLSDELCIICAGKKSTDALVAAERADDLYKRPEGDCVSIGETAAGKHPRFVSNAVAELCGQPRLADARGTDDGDKAAGTFGDGTRVGLTQRMQLLGAAHERSVETTRISGCAFDHAEHVPGDDRAALPFNGQLIARLEHRRVRHQPTGALPKENLAGARRLFESLRNVDGIAGNEHLSAGPVAGDDLAGIDADADADVGRRAHARARR